MDYFQKYLQSLPMPLEKDIQEGLLAKYAKTKDADIREKLIVHNLRLVVSAVSKFLKYGNPKFEDAMQVGTIGLVNAIDNYDCERGGNFSTYAYVCLKGVLLRELNRDNNSSDALGHCSFQGSLPDEEQDIFYYIGQEDSFEQDFAEMDRINDCLKDLDPKDRLIAEHRFGLNGKQQLTIGEVALLVGEKPSIVERRFLKIREKIIKYYLSDKDLGSGLVKIKDIYESADITTSDVIEYYEGINSIRNKQVLEYLYGLFDKPCLTKKQVADKLGVDLSLISQIQKRMVKRVTSKKLKEKNGKNSFVSVREIEEYCKNIQDGVRKEVVEHFYGFNGKEKLSCRDIAEKFNQTTQYVYGILYSVKNAIRRQADACSVNGITD